MKRAAAPKVRTIDARRLLERGEHPLPQVLAALADGDTVVVITPFLPSPLIERLQGDGFAALPERHSDGSWHTQFSRS